MRTLTILFLLVVAMAIILKPPTEVKGLIAQEQITVKIKPYLKVAVSGDRVESQYFYNDTTFNTDSGNILFFKWIPENDRTASRIDTIIVLQDTVLGALNARW
jgi:hypothetical protein